MRRSILIPLTLASVAILAGCNSQASTAAVTESALRAAVAERSTSAQSDAQHSVHSPLPFPLLGVHFDDRSRAAITADLEQAGLHPGKPDSPWCDWFSQGTAAAQLPGVGTVKVCYTAAGAWAETDVIYPGESSFDDPPQGHAPGLLSLAQDVTAKYGPPATAQGDAEVGPVEMVWHVAGGGEVALLRQFPVRTLTLAMLDLPRKLQMAQEAQAAAQAEQAARAKTPNPLD